MPVLASNIDRKSVKYQENAKSMRHLVDALQKNGDLSGSVRAQAQGAIAAVMLQGMSCSLERFGDGVLEHERKGGS